MIRITAVWERVSQTSLRQKRKSQSLRSVPPSATSRPHFRWPCNIIYISNTNTTQQCRCSNSLLMSCGMPEATRLELVSTQKHSLSLQYSECLTLKISLVHTLSMYQSLINCYRINIILIRELDIIYERLLFECNLGTPELRNKTLSKLLHFNQYHHQTRPRLLQQPRKWASNTSKHRQRPLAAHARLTVIRAPPLQTTSIILYSCTLIALATHHIKLGTKNKILLFLVYCSLNHLRNLNS